MSFGTVSISPYIKEYSASAKSQESSLASHGMLRAPGTTRPFIPHKEATGKYRTGLDKDAQYLLKMSKEERKIEEDKIDAMLAILKKAFPDVDFGPHSKIWNVWSNEPFKANKVNAANTDIYLHPDRDIMDLLTYAWVRVSPVIAKNKAAIENGECPDCQYYLNDEAAETKVMFNKKMAVNKATASLEKLKDDPTKIKKVARLMGLPVTEDTSLERCYILLDTELKESQVRRGENAGRGTIGLFNEICELSDEVLNVKDLVEKAIRHNIYRETGDKLTEGTITIADSKADLVRTLLKPDNQKELLALMARVKVKEQTNQ